MEITRGTPAPGVAAFFGDHSSLYLTFASNQIYAVLANVAATVLGCLVAGAAGMAAAKAVG